MKKIWQLFKFTKSRKQVKHGPKGINTVGHRNYVGGLWDEIGKLQYEFLKEQGLKPDDVILDIACGSLRAGVHLIPYLDEGNYLGIDKENILIKLGLEKELDPKIIKEKKPEFLISKNFEFNKLSKTPNFAIAQSLFTHLPPDTINICLKKLKINFAKDGVFFATYFITEKVKINPKNGHDHKIFEYTNEEIISFGEKNGWNVDIIGHWNHPRNQFMVKYTLGNI